MVDDVNLEEESQECEERNEISAGYLSIKITGLVHMEEFMQGATESD